MTVSSTRLPLLKKYSELLAHTSILCKSILREATSSIPILFASKVLVIASFLLPTIRQALYSAIRDLFPPSSVITPDLTQDLHSTSQTLPSATSDSPRIPHVHSLLDLTAESSETKPHTGSFGEVSETTSDGGKLNSGFFRQETCFLDVTREQVISAETPLTSPTPFARSQFSPIPSKSPPPEDSQSPAVNDSQEGLLQVKDYTIVSDDLCLRHLRNTETQKQYSEMVMMMPTLFHWERVIGATSVEGFQDSLFWRERWRLAGIDDDQVPHLRQFHAEFHSHVVRTHRRLPAVHENSSISVIPINPQILTNPSFPGIFCFSARCCRWCRNRWYYSTTWEYGDAKGCRQRPNWRNLPQNVATASSRKSGCSGVSSRWRCVSAISSCTRMS